MPYLRFKGFDEGFLRERLTLLVEEFSRVAAVPQEVVKVEALSVTRITETPRSVEIFMFPRPQEKHDAIAATLHALLSHFDYRNVHIFFVLLAPSLYYRDGEPLKSVSWLP
ncbi:DUF1904 family protein [Geobacter pickeringii]|uniref:DUF1904 domain-containing protein n=1 Tax=Geobacter pickeringii TaxID=345632 RepID=A0A0B5BE61_9BACT|nr:DUF1904 family protein [Geobacter pickeringii]AJE02331.1 hypothetical protein GPICK_02125 [Geobacter pickeringii]